MRQSFIKIILAAVLAGISTIFNPVEASIQDTLTWSWEVTTTVSTATKSFVPEFKGNLRVEWGDGGIEIFSDSLSGKTLSHTYLQPGAFSCKALSQAISYFKADSKRLLTLDPSKANSLSYLSCTSNQLATLNLSGSGELVSLYCSGNDLQSLNVSACGKLQTLTCSDNQLKALDVSALPALKKLTCHTNALSSLLVAPDGALSYVSCTSCSLQVGALHTLFEQLPSLTAQPTSKNLYILNNPGSTACSVQAAVQKNWVSDKVSNSCVFYMGKATGQAGKVVEIPVALTNPVPVIAFELDLSFPEGFEPDTLLSGLDETRKGNHLMTLTKLNVSGNVYKVLAYSMKAGEIFKNSTGTIFKIIGKTPDSAAVYPLRILKSVLIDTATNEQPVLLQDADLAVLPVTVNGDTNADGRLDVTDVVALVASINGRTPYGFNPKAADLDMNGTLNVADVARLVVLISRSVYAGTNPDVVPEPETGFKVSGQALKLGVREAVSNPGSLEICLENPVPVQALQFDVCLPGDFVPENPSVQVARNRGHQIQLRQLEGNRYRVLIYALRPDAFLEGDSGVVAVLPLKKVSGEEGSSFPVVLEHVIASDANLRSLDLQNAQAEILLKPINPLKSIQVGAGDGRLWVSGEQLSSIAVWSAEGKPFFTGRPENPVFFERFLPCGMYVVRATSASLPAVVAKVVVFR